MDNVLVKNGIIRHDFITGKCKHGVVIMGTRTLEAGGYIYAPYIPLQHTERIYNPNDFQPTQGVQSRYARTVVDNRFYGHISVSDLDSLDDD